jgi:hypothetical protein
MNIRTAAMFLVLLLFFNSTRAQDTLIVDNGKPYPNIVKVSLTNSLLYNNAVQLIYERVLNKKRSFVLFGGYEEFPLDIKLVRSDVNLGRSVSKSGFSAGFEYRFYLAKENKYHAPRGVFIAPFVSYHGFKGERIVNDSAHTQSVTLNTTVGFGNIGASLGYQFVLWKRFVIDAVMFGPAITSYRFKAKMDGHLTGVDDNELLQQIIDAMKDKLPVLERLTEGGEVNSSGVESFWSGGFRYNISIGYRF